MASSTRRVTRRTVRQTVKHEGITGVNLETCAANIVARLGLPPTYNRKAYEELLRLDSNGEIVLVDAVLRPTTEKESKAMREATATEATRIRRTRARTRSRQHGGVRNLQVRTTMPLPASLT